MVSDIRPMHYLQLGVLQQLSRLCLEFLNPRRKLTKPRATLAVSFTLHLLPKPTPRGISLVIYGTGH